mmetsp:Transcript_37432/g.90844  ORF Transcript_37432/g.90844 Transcript_37432/m.90844 type:complete len:405 (+) Transcript_37432:141-1355(+)|eukprot:CAMPEP_0113628270 /NCGR_PEP_ID=MMETSP0017_2-20120614/14647_1 /TAXON_ID=2856 /ORGANISM="Cylindrotheca closterium" /LENGTH=404 /DNA_ID=CAMNT_0000538567 /DNA_START=62 /DNA_END=1276 /DNA_ORIENTATION=+ /assembly_acc=CAM_ASM_000147
MRSGARKRSAEDLKRLGQEEIITLGAPLRSSSQEPRRRRSSLATATSGDTEDTDNDNNDNNNNNAAGFAFGSGHVAQCLTRELNNLEPTGQQEVTQDIYGIDVPNAKAYFEQEDFDALQTEIDAIEEGEGKDAYLQAEQMSRDFVHNPKFRILFLRAALGHYKKAAKRLVRHFKTKLDLFGQDKLVKEITLEDLNEDDMESLRSGGFQVLPKPDRAGRSILFGRYTCFKYKEPANIIRSLWYMWMTLLESETNQIKGVTAIGYENGRSPLERYDHMDNDASQIASFEMSSHGHGGFDRNLAKQITTIPLSVPVRPVGYHLCADSDQWIATLNMVVATICKFMRLRMRLHHGSDQECKYQLMTHGIPADLIPVEGDGSINLTNHLEWIEQRRALEAARHNSSVQD